MKVGTVDRNVNRTRLVMWNEDTITNRTYSLEVEVPAGSDVGFAPGDNVTVTIEPKVGP